MPRSNLPPSTSMTTGRSSCQLALRPPILLYRDNIDDVVGFLHRCDALRLVARDSSASPGLLRGGRPHLLPFPRDAAQRAAGQDSSATKERIGLVSTNMATFRG